MLLSKTGKARTRQLVALALLSSSVWLSAATAQADFCQTGTVRDYEKPLKRLPAVPAPPFDDRLNFAPAGTYLSRFTYGPLQVGPGKRGFDLSYSPYEGSPPSRRLDWQVTSRLFTVNRSGARIGRPRTIEKYVKRLRPEGEGNLGFAFEVPGNPALYRLEIVFENKAGRRLGRFGENFRVLNPSL